MIKLTSLNGREVFVNAELIRTVEATPDTMITLSTEHKMIVREGVDEVVRRVMRYRREIRRDAERFVVQKRQDVQDEGS